MSRRQSDVLDFTGVTVETLQGLAMLLCRVAVRIGARFASLAMPGPALVSRTDVDLIADSGIKFEDLGELDPHDVTRAKREKNVIVGDHRG